jgi:hypothetical protein
MSTYLIIIDVSSGLLELSQFRLAHLLPVKENRSEERLPASGADVSHHNATAIGEDA